MNETEKEIIRQELYRVFHIYHENYLVTVKLMRIYRWVEQRTGDDALATMQRLYIEWPARRKQQKLDQLFNLIQSIEMRHLAAPSNASVPGNDVYVGVSRW
jgi:hypothetical protein